MRNGSLLNLCIYEFSLLDICASHLRAVWRLIRQDGNRGVEHTFWELDKILILLIKMELSLQGSLSHGQVALVSCLVFSELWLRKSRRSPIVISFLPGGVPL